MGFAGDHSFGRLTTNLVVSVTALPAATTCSPKSNACVPKRPLSVASWFELVVLVTVAAAVTVAVARLADSLGSTWTSVTSSRSILRR